MLKTWDIFDTLIARRCILPRVVFQIMEQKTRLKGFSKARIAAEQYAASKVPNYKLDDIYNEFERIVTNLKPETCASLKKLECEVEIEQAIPITENILQVKSNDILISDMYLPEKIIRKMLEKCGLLVPVEIVITSGGKSSGRIWKQISEQNQFVFHIGDNEIADVKNPRDVGFDSALTILNRPISVEQAFLKKNFNFAAYLREIRLRNPYSEEEKRLYWQFFTLNVGILIILVQLIDDLQKKCGFEYLGFCGRDTYYLWLLYKKFKEDHNEKPPANDYLYYSRKLVYNSQNELANYFSSKIANQKALMIDLGGTGTRLKKLRTEKNFNYSILLCFNYETKKLVNWIRAVEPFQVLGAESNDFYFVSNFVYTLEFLNRATHNTPIKLDNVQIGQKLIPSITFSEISDTENLDVLLGCMQEVLKSDIPWRGGGRKMHWKILHN